MTKKAKGDDGEEIVTKSGTDEEEQNGAEGFDGAENNGAGSQADKGNDHGKPGSSERLPKEGQNVHWKVGRNWTEGISHVLSLEVNIVPADGIALFKELLRIFCTKRRRWTESTQKPRKTSRASS